VEEKVREEGHLQGRLEVVYERVREVPDEADRVREQGLSDGG
jgi:hypothetical protein